MGTKPRFPHIITFGNVPQKLTSNFFTAQRKEDKSSPEFFISLNITVIGELPRIPSARSLPAICPIVKQKIGTFHL